MNYTYLLLSLLLIGSCGTSNPSTETIEPEKAELQAISELKVEQTSEEKLIGTWEFEDTALEVLQVITYNRDGTYAMNMAGMDINGTWELKDNILITKSRPDAEGQKKTITKLNSDTLTTFWEPKGGTGREMKYVRTK